MTKLSVNIPDKLLEDTAKSRIKTLERSLKAKETKIRRLEKKVNDLKATLKLYERYNNRLTALIGAAEQLVEVARNHWDLVDPENEW